MIATLKYDHGYYCSNCRMRHHGTRPYCEFCGAQFSNWGNVLYQQAKEIENDKIHDDSYYDDFDYDDVYEDR